jgi:hypothetical protein
MSGFQEVKLQGINLTKHPNKPFIGFYLGSTEHNGNYGNEIHHNFQKQKDNELATIYGFTSLNAKLEKVEKGSLVRLTYLGTEAVKTKKFGTKEVHQVKVEVDSSQSIVDRLDKIESPAVDKNPEPQPEPVTENVDEW